MGKSTTSITEINDDHRVLIVGKTGTGKTTLAAALLNGIDRLIVIDSKFNMRSDEWRAEILHEVPKTLPDQFRYIIRLDDPTLAGEDLIKFEDYYLYVDELFAVFPGALSASPGWRGLWSRGRERHIAVWAGVQRPASIPKLTKTEADHFFVFRLVDPDDLKNLSSMIGITIPRLRDHQFLYANPNKDVYIQYNRLELQRSNLTRA